MINRIKHFFTSSLGAIILIILCLLGGTIIILLDRAEIEAAQEIPDKDPVQVPTDLMNNDPDERKVIKTQIMGRELNLSPSNESNRNDPEYDAKLKQLAKENDKLKRLLDKLESVGRSVSETVTDNNKRVYLPIEIVSNIPDKKLDSTAFLNIGDPIPCRLLYNVNSTTEESPIIGYVTKDVWNDGQLVIPKDTKVISFGAGDFDRNRILPNNQWHLVIKDGSEDNAKHLQGNFKCIHKDRAIEQMSNYLEGTEGLYAEIMKDDNWKNLKINSFEVLKNIADVEKDKITKINQLNDNIVQTEDQTYKNVALTLGQSTLNQYITEAVSEIDKKGYFLHVKKGTPFYLIPLENIFKDDFKKPKK